MITYVADYIPPKAEVTVRILWGAPKNRKVSKPQIECLRAGSGKPLFSGRPIAENTVFIGSDDFARAKPGNIRVPHSQTEIC